MQRVGGDDRTGDADAIQQDGEHRDLVRFRACFCLARDGAMDMIEGGQQVHAGFPAAGRTRRVLPSTAMTRRWFGPGLVACCAQAPAASSKASASRRCKVRRNVGSGGTARLTPSASSVASSASAAHSAIAVNERAPATTAHSARPKMTASRCLTPRRCRGSATPASIASNPGCPAAPSPASSARWPIAGSISDDGGAGMVPREQSGWRENRHDHPKGRARALTRPSPACRCLPTAVKRLCRHPALSTEAKHHDGPSVPPPHTASQPVG